MLRLSLLFFIVTALRVSAQTRVAVGFWNVENLYDTVNDPLTDDDEFTPAGKNKWTTDKYGLKLEHLASVIADMGREQQEQGPALVGLCEVENSVVLHDLTRAIGALKRKYDFVHIEGEDARGIDVALLYKPSAFDLVHVRAFPVVLPDTNHKTRHILLVSGTLYGEPFTVLVNHWPSRRGGEHASRPRRLAAAKVAARICDSLRTNEPATNLLLMGDFNDDPVSYSIRKVLRASSTQDSGLLYNPFIDLFRRGIGTLAFNDRWNLFDQQLLSKNMLDGKGWQFSSAHVYAPGYLRSQKGNFRDYPFRTYSAGVYTGGYSDHFPSYIVLQRSVGKR
jgi:hypothetical protein